MESLGVKLFRLGAVALALTLAGCNANGARAQGDFNAAGTRLGQGDIGRGFSDGANATGDAITHTAHQVGDAFRR